MHHTAKRCVQWAVGLWLVGAVVLIYGAQAYVGIADAAGAGAEVGLDVLNIVLTIVRSAVFPMGAALVGAAVVIQASPAAARPHDGELGEERAPTGGAED